MSHDKKLIYCMSTVAFAALLFCFLVKVGDGKLLTAGVLLALTVCTLLLIRKRSAVSIRSREVILLSAIFASLYVILAQGFGIYFGFYKNPYFVTPKIFFLQVLPVVAIIICSEILRYVFLAQKNRYAAVLSYLFCVIADVLIFSNIDGITNFNQFMDLVGLAFFPAISANIYYHFASKRFGIIPNAVFRIITTLYVYFVSSLANTSDALSACIKIFLPIIMLALISALYETKKKKVVRHTQKLSMLAMVASFIVIISVAMLVSCQFRFSAIVIATESMTGEINKGDVIIYERYDDQIIKEGQVVVFLQNQNKIVHRVVKIERIENEVRYITKGDANESEDFGYITDKDIIGLTNTKLAYFGYPTLWLRELLESSN